MMRAAAAASPPPPFFSRCGVVLWALSLRCDRSKSTREGAKLVDGDMMKLNPQFSPSEVNYTDGSSIETVPEMV